MCLLQAIWGKICLYQSCPPQTVWGQPSDLKFQDTADFDWMHVLLNFWSIKPHHIMIDRSYRSSIRVLSITVTLIDTCMNVGLFVTAHVIIFPNIAAAAVLCVLLEIRLSKLSILEYDIASSRCILVVYVYWSLLSSLHSSLITFARRSIASFCHYRQHH